MSGSRSGFAITITAVDQASKSIDAINKRIAAIQAPADRLQRSFGKLAENTGVAQLSRGMGNLARESFAAFENMGRMVGPLGIITGAASVAGLARLSSEFAQLGTQLLFASQRTGVGVQQLSALQGAARLAGSSAGALTSGIKTLGDNLVNAAAGRAPDAVIAFNYLGVAVRDAHGQLRKAADILPEVADKLASIKDPTIQVDVATRLFGGAAEDLLPFLRQGAAGIEAWRKQMERTGATMTPEMAKHANEMREAFQRLALDFEGIGNRMADRWSGTVTGITKQMSEWIEKNKQTADSLTNLGLAITALGLIKPAAWVLRFLGIGAGAVPVAAGAAIGATYLVNKGKQEEFKAAAAKLGFDATPTSVFNPIPDFVNQTTGERLSWADMGRRLGPPYSNNVGGGLSIGGRPDVNPNAPNGVPPVGPRFGPQQFTPTAPELTPDARGLLKTIARDESHGDYNVLYGGGHFAGDQFPQWAGLDNSHAAGAYQFQPGTFAGVQRQRPDITDFSPANQDRAAWHLAQVDYHRRTGRDLTIDLKDPMQHQRIASVLQPTWTSTNKPGWADRLTKNLAAANAGPRVAVAPPVAQAPPPPPAPIPVQAPPVQVAPAAQAPPAQVGPTGSGAPPAPTTTTVRGSADLRVRIETPNPVGTRTTATTEGDLFGAPRIETAMPQ